MRTAILIVTLLGVLPDASELRAIDHFFTIGGGYAPEGNQASLEANVQFFQRVIARTHNSSPPQRIHFADGHDPAADLQVLAKRRGPSSLAVKLLEEIFGTPGNAEDRVAYRNHEVTDVAASSSLRELRAGFDVVRGQLKAGDRLIVYVTAHGGSAKGNAPYDTSITCWGHRELNMREFSTWLDTLPEAVPVLLVMTQCYCGGFAHSLFVKGDIEEGLAANVRTGFYAQRHDLPAAGCRPDVENDEEYSSFFWGAFIGQTRAGKVATDVDCDGDGSVSFAEAHAYAVVASQTIDIPLRGSDALLRIISRIPNYEVDDADTQPRSQSDRSNDSVDRRDNRSSETLIDMSGSIRALADLGTTVEERIITGLAEQLNLALSQDVGQLFEKYADAQRDYRSARRGGGQFGGRRSRTGFGRRRDVREAILDRWPELEEQSTWPESDLLAGDAAVAFVKQVEMLPSYQAYARGRDQREAARVATLDAEMKQVRFQRLIHTLESVVLAANAKAVASPEMLRRLEAMLKLEHSAFR